MITGGSKGKEIVLAFPDLNETNISTHKRNHMGLKSQPKASPPEVDPAELDLMGSPDVVKIVERQVNKFEILERRRALTPQEERERARFVEFLIKIEITKLESRDKPQQNDDWIEREMEKVRNGYYDRKPTATA